MDTAETLATLDKTKTKQYTKTQKTKQMSNTTSIKNQGVDTEVVSMLLVYSKRVGHD